MTGPGEGALSGLRVLDLSRVLAGPLCGQLLADHGAEVIKVEAPGGDETRTWGPPFVGEESSAYFEALNRNKANLCLDLGAEAGREVLRDLIARADVLVENYKAGTLERWGFGDEMLAATYPALVHCRITGFGVDGPMGGMPGYDAVAQAYSGLMSVNGEPDGEPLRVGVPIADMVTGIYAFSGILLALQERNRSGRGQLVDCTLLDTAVSLLHPHSGAYLTDGRVPVRTGSAHPTIAPYETFPASDGLLFVAAGNDRQFGTLLGELGLSAYAEDPRFVHNSDRVAHRLELRDLLREAIATRPAMELTTALLAQGVPATRVNDVAQAMEDPHVLHRGLRVAIDGFEGVGIPIKLDRTPGSVRQAPRRRGHDTLHVLRDELGYDEQTVRRLLDGQVAREAGEPASS